MSSSDRNPGDVLDRRYRLIERLGRGGFGDVWHAEELLPDGAPFRDVAIKLLDGGDTTDWAEEAKLLASFRHPSLVTVYAAGILDDGGSGVRFVAMELLLGKSLSDVLRARGPIPWRRALGWALSAATALDVIHARGVIHLDLKPANLFLTTEGALKVLDFGIARRKGDLRRTTGAPRERPTRADSSLFEIAHDGGTRSPPPTRSPQTPPGLQTWESQTIEDEPPASVTDVFGATRPIGAASRTRVVVGTPGFIAPEVLELGEPTAAADAYAFAATIAQLITGHLPQDAPDEPVTWEDSTAVSAWLDGLRRATMRGSLKPFLVDPERVPRGLMRLLVRLLAVEPAQRGVVPGGLAALFEEVWDRPFGVPDPPYVGLSPIPPDAEGLLFGRDDDVGRLGRDLERSPSVALHGPRGAGKTSLAIAGLVPYLARRGADGKDDWIALHVVPGEDPDDALMDAFAARSIERASGVDALAAHAERSPIGIALVVDPLGDLARAPKDARERIEALVIAIASGPLRPGLRLITVMDDESAPAILAMDELGPALRASLRFAGAPPVTAIHDITAAPAHFAGVPLTGIDAVAEDLTRELRAGPARLPFVALALRTWWGTRSDAGLGHAGWTAMGGVNGAIAKHADRVLSALSAEDALLAEEILLRLSTTSGVPVSWIRAELVAAIAAGPRGRGDAAKVARVLAALEREHLVRASRASVEIGHPALLTRWDRVVSARLREMDRLALLERLREAASAWDRSERRRDMLMSSEALRELRAQAIVVGRDSAFAGRSIADGGAAKLGLTTVEREFVAASLHLAKVRGVQRASAMIVVIAVIVLGLAGNEMVARARRAEQEADRRAAQLAEVTELAARSRRTTDPYHRVAYAAAAMARGSTDGMLPLDLFFNASGLVRADFLTLDHVRGPSFPWGGRFMIGEGSASLLALVDLAPHEPEVIDEVDLDFDPDDKSQGHFKKPRFGVFRPHDAPLVERVPLAFTTGFVTRSTSGEVKIFRIRGDGSVALAAIAPVRCSGAVQAATAAPVLACASERGLLRWDLRRGRGAEVIDAYPFGGNVSAISADGDRVVAIDGSVALLWSSTEGWAIEHRAPTPLVFAVVSPRDRAVALVEEGAFSIVGDDPKNRGAVLFRERLTANRATFGGMPSSARFSAAGIDLAICGASGRGAYYYLRRGGRAPSDPLPKDDPCARVREQNEPVVIPEGGEIAELSGLRMGDHGPRRGGFRLSKYRFLGRDLALLDAGRRPSTGTKEGRPAAERLLRFVARDDHGDPEIAPAGLAVSAIERADNVVLAQVGADVNVYTLPDEGILFSRPGNLLPRCADGRSLAWQSSKTSFNVIDVYKGTLIAEIPREPAFVIGTDGACAHLYTQRLDGAIVAAPLSPGGRARVLGVADGYVYDARLVAPRGDAPGALILALSSGAIARVMDTTLAIEVLGYASPRATAIGEGPRPGEIAYADATGVAILSRAGAQRVLDTNGSFVWEDLSVSPDRSSMLLVSSDRIAALDLIRRELIGAIAIEGRTRLSRWDDEGSVLAWSYDRMGQVEGIVIPRGVSLARAVSEVVSNLDVDRGKLVPKR